MERLLAKAHSGEDTVWDGDMGYKVAYLRKVRKQLETSKETSSAPQTNVSKWTGGVVPYAFNANVTEDNQTRFRAACAEWEAVANVKFVPRTTERNYIEVQSASVNSATVGMQGGRQYLRMYNWTSKYIICHELAHALGIAHEHSRSDRDNFVTIEFANVQSGTEHNFNKMPTNVTATTYDFDSVMHYRADAFTSNGKDTIVPKPEYRSKAYNMGQRSRLSAGDVQGMVALYGAKNAAVLAYVSHVSFDDRNSRGSGNGDGAVNAGETIDLDVVLRNESTSAASNVTAKLATSSAYATIAKSSASLGTIDSSASATVSGLAFSVSATAPIDTTIDFVLTLSSAQGTSTAAISVTVTGQLAVSHTGTTVYDGIGGFGGGGTGNGDRVIHRGESIDLEVDLRNDGSSTLTDVEAALTSSSPYVTITDDTLSVGRMTSGQTRTASDFDFDISKTTPPGQVIDFVLTISSDQGSTTKSLSYTVYPGEKYTVAPSVSGSGTIAPNKAQTVAYGGSATFTATPAAGYYVQEWLRDGHLAQSGGSSFTSAGTTANTNITVVFARIPAGSFAVTASAGEGGSVSPAHTQHVAPGSTVVLQATAQHGYRVSQWFYNETPVAATGDSLILSDVNENASVRVEFMPVSALGFASFPPAEPQPRAFGFYDERGDYCGYLVLRRDAERRIGGIRAIGLTLHRDVNAATEERRGVEIRFNAKGFPSQYVDSNGTVLTLGKGTDGSIRVTGRNQLGARVRTTIEDSLATVTRLLNDLKAPLANARRANFANVGAKAEPNRAIVAELFAKTSRLASTIHSGIGSTAETSAIEPASQYDAAFDAALQACELSTTESAYCDRIDFTSGALTATEVSGHLAIAAKLKRLTRSEVLPRGIEICERIAGDAPPRP